MSDSWENGYTQGRILGELQKHNRIMEQQARLRQENQEIYNDLIKKYNELVTKYNSDTSRFIAQRDTLGDIVKENIDKLPMSLEEIRTLVNENGDEAARQSLTPR